MEKKSDCCDYDEEDQIMFQSDKNWDFGKENLMSFTIAATDATPEISIIVSSSTEKFQEYLSDIDVEQLLIDSNHDLYNLQ